MGSYQVRFCAWANSWSFSAKNLLIWAKYCVRHWSYRGKWFPHLGEWKRINARPKREKKSIWVGFTGKEMHLWKHWVWRPGWKSRKTYPMSRYDLSQSSSFISFVKYFPDSFNKHFFWASSVCFSLHKLLRIQISTFCWLCLIHITLISPTFFISPKLS